ncbi:MAG: Uma2 family endonuclease [Pseudomonadota bacterium]
MSIPHKLAKMSPQSYLDWEKTLDIKHEYIDGEVYAMVGARDAHVTVAGNIFALLHSHLRGGPCRIYMADMKVRVESVNAFFYPDVVVTCDERDRKNDYFKIHPHVVIEVLSDSTAAYDRGQKFARYRASPALREYVIIDPDRISVEVFRLDNTGHWVLYPFSAGQKVEFASVDFRVAIEALYENVTVPPEIPPLSDP